MNLYRLIIFLAMITSSFTAGPEPAEEQLEPLGATVLKAIEVIASKILEEELPSHFPTTKDGSSSNAPENDLYVPHLSTSPANRVILEIIEESVRQNLAEMLPILDLRVKPKIEPLEQILDGREKPKIKLNENHHQQYSIHIQNIPEDTTEDEIKECLFERYGEYPQEVIDIPYTEVEKRGKKKVKIPVSFALVEELNGYERPYVLIRGSQYHIDRPSLLGRCMNCKLLGHKLQDCKQATRSFPPPSENCIDCRYYNENVFPSIRKKGIKRRNIKHSTDSDDCPSKKYLIDLKKRKRGKAAKPTS